MGSLFIHVDYKGCPLSATTGNTHAPDPMIGFSLCVETLIVALYVVCTWTGVINLLNHTFLAEGPMAAQIKYGGYWNKTRSMVDSGGLSSLQ